MSESDPTGATPSQAEGEDQARQPDTRTQPADGHPSQAEGEDPDRPASAESADTLRDEQQP